MVRIIASTVSAPTGSVTLIVAGKVWVLGDDALYHKYEVVNDGQGKFLWTDTGNQAGAPSGTQRGDQNLGTILWVLGADTKYHKFVLKFNGLQCVWTDELQQAAKPTTGTDETDIVIATSLYMFCTGDQLFHKFDVVSTIWTDTGTGAAVPF